MLKVKKSMDKMDYAELYEEAMDWVREQDGYYVTLEELTDRYPGLEWHDSSGVTMLIGDDGRSKIPKSDVYNLVKKTGEV